MKTGRKSIVGLFLILFPFLSLVGQTNRALVIGISKYPKGSGWPDTHAVNDCTLIVPLLEANGYKGNITKLINKEATKANIIKEFKQLASKSKRDDYIYIHFSGHGQQMADDNGDEIDLLDEALIPYDAHYRYVPGKYEGENHLRDDEMEKLLDEIRRKIGKNGNLLVVLDACHSGSGTRIIEEEDYVRGTTYIFAPPGYEPEPCDSTTFRLTHHSDEHLAPITVLSACQPDELNFEYRAGYPSVYYGSLSFFFCEAMKERRENETNREFYLRLKDKMVAYFKKQNQQQTPFFDSTAGNGLFNISK